MKYLIAVIQPWKLEDVKEGLAGLGVHGLTVTEVKGYGRQKGKKEIYRGSEYDVQFVPKSKIEVAVSDELAEEVADIIQSRAASGTIGDGKVFTLPLDSVMRIRTAEVGEAAL